MTATFHSRFSALDLGKIILAFLLFIVAEETVQFPDGKRGIDLGTCTLAFTGVMTYPSADTGERMFLFEELQGLFVSAVIYQSDKALDAYVGWTGGLAWGSSPLAYSECSGNSLWVLFEYCFTKIELFVVIVRGKKQDRPLRIRRSLCIW